MEKIKIDQIEDGLQYKIVAGSNISINNSNPKAPVISATGTAGNYKRYVALLTQSGTDAPVATVLENTLGGSIVWTRNETGQYLATLTGAFTLNKTIVFATTGWRGSVLINTYSINVNTVSVDTFSTNDSSFRIDDAMDRSAFEIRVYN